MTKDEALDVLDLAVQQHRTFLAFDTRQKALAARTTLYRTRADELAQLWRDDPALARDHPYDDLTVSVRDRYSMQPSGNELASEGSLLTITNTSHEDYEPDFEILGEEEVVSLLP